MASLSSRDILDVMRTYGLAGIDSVPRHIESVKITHPSPISTLASFRFAGQQYYVLSDSTADDDADYIIDRIKSAKGDVTGHLIENPNSDALTYAIPFKGKEYYLYQVIPDKKRLDSELARIYPDQSRSTWQKYIKAGYVQVNDNIVESPKYEVASNDRIDLNIPDKSDYTRHELPIIYMDDNVIVINKPCGILTHSKGVLNDEFTVADFFKRYTTYNLDTNRPGIVHRLDRDTSGILIGARNPETAGLLQRQFSDRKAKKTYYAVVSGKPKLDKAIIDLPIDRNPTSPSTFRVDPNGKPAITKYEVLATENNRSLVKLQPQTGRTHQLRVHMKYLNTPILGDRVYYKPSDRLYLHAYSLEITIPQGNRQIFMAPLPDEFKNKFQGVSI